MTTMTKERSLFEDAFDFARSAIACGPVTATLSVVRS